MQSLSRKQEVTIKTLYTRHGRKKLGLSICEGFKVCKEFEKYHKDLISFAICNEDFKSDLFLTDLIHISNAQFTKISAAVNSQGVLFVVQRPKIYSVITELKNPFSILLDKISDPGNFGTIIRTAKSIGLTQLFYTKGSADPFSDKVIRAAMGAQFSIDLIELLDIKTALVQFKRNNRNGVFRTSPHNGNSCFNEKSLFDNSVIIFGSEAFGLNEIFGSVDVSIPMPGKFESVNLAQATTVIMFEYVRRQESQNKN